MKREINLQRLSGFEMPTRLNCGYIIYHYYFKDLKHVFDAYIKEHDNVFDIGCGNKPFEKYIRNLTKTGDYQGCDVVQSSEQKADIICEATNIPEQSDKYDVVICTQVIEHVFDHSKVFEEAYRLLKKGGYFIVSSNFVWRIHEAPYDFYRFTKYGFEQLLENAGFTVKEEKVNGGKFAALGQLIIHCFLTGQRKNFFIKKIRGCFIFFCNIVFPWLDDKKKDELYTLNYVFVGQK
ncbi:MAG: class I SAM-dependent methyltransferase [Dysgonamonadaceae bacterium]|jgi:SAM-dependent methyltransferase|nr:class I SAM-dependent methyltransferase [Dysgonamonadaceae bacterium]